MLAPARPVRATRVSAGSRSWGCRSGVQRGAARPAGRAPGGTGRCASAPTDRCRMQPPEARTRARQQPEIARDIRLWIGSVDAVRRTRRAATRNRASVIERCPSATGRRHAAPGPALRRCGTHHLAHRRWPTARTAARRGPTCGCAACRRLAVGPVTGRLRDRYLRRWQAQVATRIAAGVPGPRAPTGCRALRPLPGTARHTGAPCPRGRKSRCPG